MDVTLIGSKSTVTPTSKERLLLIFADFTICDR